MAHVSGTPERPPAPAKIKILATADHLFYTEGIHTVGVDRIIALAHVTKATFYKHYRSKDLLILAYIAARSNAIRERIDDLEATLPSPATVLRAIADEIGAAVVSEGFHGCPFVNAAAQFVDPDHPVHAAVTEHREWFSSRIEGLFRDMGHDAPGDAADDFVLARDGALAAGHIGDPIAAQAALGRAAARALGEG